MHMRDLTSWSPQDIRRKLIEMYCIDPGDELQGWLNGTLKPKFKLSTFEKAVWYHRAYEMITKLRRTRPELRDEEIVGIVSKTLPVHISASTIYKWVTGKSRPNITLLKLTRETLPAIAYCVGVLCGDYRRTVGGLKARDREFVEYYAKMYEKATGVKVRLHRSKDGYWITYESGGWLKSCWATGLWKIFAELDPVNWLKGLFDSEGGVSPVCYHKRKILRSVELYLAIGDPEVKYMAKRELERLGFRVRERHRSGEIRIIDGKIRVFKDYWHLYVRGWNHAANFARFIDFRINRRREMLNDLLKLRPLPPQMRYKLWTQKYQKVNGKWRRIPLTPNS